MSADTILSTASGTNGTYLFSMALQLANVASIFNNSGLNVTVFAPSDQAFLGAIGALGLPQSVLEQPENAVKMAPILLYHTIRPAVTSSALVVDGPHEWPCAFDPFALNQMTLGTMGNASAVRVVSIGTDANVIAANISAGSSVIHVIDSVLLPFFPSAFAAIARDPRTATLEALAVDLAPATLALLNPLADVTVFAPVNTAFITALSNGSALLAQLRSSPIGAQYLINYHIVPKPLLNLTSLGATANLSTLAGLKLTLTNSGGNTVVSFPGGSANVVTSYTVGFNVDGTQRAAVYLIDQVLIPPAMNTIEAALTAKLDATVLLAALKASSAYASLPSRSDFKGTLLVPTDAAFNAFLLGKAWTAAALLASPNGLKQLLDLHVIPNTVLSLSTITTNVTTTLTTSSGANTLTVTKSASGTVIFKSTATNTTAKALGYEYYAGANVGTVTTVIFIDAVLLPGTLTVDGGAATVAAPSPFAMLLCSIFAAALLHFFGRR